MKILVCGGRNYADKAAVDRILNEFHSQTPLIIQGGARGADALAKRWADQWGVHCAEIKALWSWHRHGAGPRRNTAMLSLQPDICIAFPGGTGTADMVRQCEQSNILTIEVNG